jgi:holo-[acyl-carrier protein] synthase
MIYGCGVDIIEIERIESAVKKWNRRFLNRIFTTAELTYACARKSPYQHLAARFAAKEAIMKAFKSDRNGLLCWREIEIHRRANGTPQVVVKGRLKKLKDKYNIKQITVSLSHTHRYAVSTAILVGGNETFKKY